MLSEFPSIAVTSGLSDSRFTANESRSSAKNMSATERAKIALQERPTSGEVVQAEHEPSSQKPSPTTATNWNEQHRQKIKHVDLNF